MADPQSLIDQATAAGLSPDLAAFIPRIIQIESGGNPNNTTGSYTGILQMGPQERARYGGDSLGSGLALMRDNAQSFERKFGRPPDPTEFYLTHQQGLGGLSAHVSAPDQPAWQNMRGTGEGNNIAAGRQYYKGQTGPEAADRWARDAVWGNVPTQYRGQFPDGVGALTSQQFMDVWRHRLQGTPIGTQPPGAPPVATAAAPSVAPAVALAQAQAPSAPYFAGAAQAPTAETTPQAAPTGGASALSQQGQGLLTPQQLGKAAPLQLPPAFRPRVGQMKSLATLKPTLFFPRG